MPLRYPKILMIVSLIIIYILLTLSYNEGFVSRHENQNKKRKKQRHVHRKIGITQRFNIKDKLGLAINNTSMLFIASQRRKTEKSDNSGRRKKSTYGEAL